MLTLSASVHLENWAVLTTSRCETSITPSLGLPQNADILFMVGLYFGLPPMIAGRGAIHMFCTKALLSGTDAGEVGRKAEMSHQKLLADAEVKVRSCGI